MEQGSKKLPGNVYRQGFQNLSFEWEDGSEPRISYMVFDMALKELGIDLKKEKVLEIGSGNAKFLDFAKSKGVDIVGAEVNPRGEKNSPQVVARIEQLPFTDGVFGVVLAHQVFDRSVYNQDHHRMVSEVVRVLKPGGIFIATSIDDIDIRGDIPGLKLISTPEVPLQVYRKP